MLLFVFYWTCTAATLGLPGHGSFPPFRLSPVGTEHMLLPTHAAATAALALVGSPWQDVPGTKRPQPLACSACNCITRVTGHRQGKSPPPPPLSLQLPLQIILRITKTTTSTTTTTAVPTATATTATTTTTTTARLATGYWPCLHRRGRRRPRP